MLVTDQAKLIRMQVSGMRVIGRNSAGIKLFSVANNEHVVSAAKIDESVEDDVVSAEEVADGVSEGDVSANEAPDAPQTPTEE
jgi:DNA gyrase subunit A